MSISNFGAAGVRPGVCTSTTRPTAPYTGQIIYETDTELMSVWNGSFWEPKGNISIFPSSSARATSVPVPTEGMVTYLQDVDELEVYNGSEWLRVVTTTDDDSITTSGDIRSTSGGPDGGLSMRRWPANSNFMTLSTNGMTSTEYALITDGTDVFLGAGSGGSTYVRGPSNGTTHQIQVSGSSVNVSGYLMSPSTPCFTAHAISQSFTAPGYVVPTTVVLNNGNHYSTANGRFTAPIAGNYFFIFSGFKETSVGPPTSYWFYRNGAIFNGGLRAYQDNGGYAAVGPIQCVINMAAGDYMQVYLSNGGLHGNQNCMYAGFLIG